MSKFIYILVLLTVVSIGINSQTESPVLSEPPKFDNLVGTAVSFDWSDVAGANYYHMQIVTDSNTSPVADTITTATSDYFIPSGILQPNTVYYWRVQALYAGQFSEYFVFKTAGTPEQEVGRVQDLITIYAEEEEISDNQANILNNRLQQVSYQSGLHHYNVAILHLYIYEFRLLILRVSNQISSDVYDDLMEEGDYLLGVVRAVQNGNSPILIPPVQPVKFELSQNYPNPFNPSTTIEYSIPKGTFVSLVIYNSIGQEVSHLVNETKDAGTYIVDWNAGRLSSGVYFYRLTAGEFTETKRMILAK